MSTMEKRRAETFSIASDETAVMENKKVTDSPFRDDWNESSLYGLYKRRKVMNTSCDSLYAFICSALLKIGCYKLHVCSGFFA